MPPQTDVRTQVRAFCRVRSGSAKPDVAMPKLTDRFLSTFMPADGAKDRLAFDTECRGLGIRATAGGGKVFLVQWTDRATGRKVREPLGAWGALTVDKAREAARIRLGRVAAGHDPKAERAARKAEDDRQRAETTRAKVAAAYTLEKLVEEWAELHLAGKRGRYASEAERALRVAFRVHLTRPAAALDYGAVTEVLDALAAGGRAPMASRTMAYGRACYGWAVKRRKLALNPFQGLPVIQGGSPTRDRVLTEAEVGAIWRAAGGLGYPFGPLVRLLLLTAQRREEVAAMRWSEISADGSTWTLPAARAKNGRAHVVHLSAPAQEVLAGVKRIKSQDFVFSTTGTTAASGFSRAKRALDTALEVEGAAAPSAIDQAAPPSWRFHDFRRTAVTWLAGAGFPPHVADRLLNHVGGTISGVAAVYQRSEFLAERRAALDAWGAHILAVGDGMEYPAVLAHLDVTRRRKRVGA
jgi:integrase